MAEINDFIDPKAEAQVKTYINSLGEIVKQYVQIFDGAVKINAATNNVLKSQKSVSDAQKQANEVSKEAARLAKEQVSAAASLEKQRQLALQNIAKAEAKEKALSAAINMEVKSLQDAQAQSSALNKIKRQLDLTTEEGRSALLKYNAALDKNTKFVRENQDAENKRFLNIGNYPKTVNLATMSVGELKKMLLELRNTSFAGKTKEEIMALNQQIGDVTDQMGDLKAMQKSLGTELGSQIAGSLKMISAGVEGVAASLTLFGVGEENIAKVQKNLVALIAVTQALGAIEDGLQTRVLQNTALRIKDSIATAYNTVVKWSNTTATAAATTAEEARAVVTGKASIMTKAAAAVQWAWNAALAANPIGLVVVGIAALIAGITALVIWQKKSNEEEEVMARKRESSIAQMNAVKEVMTDVSNTAQRSYVDEKTKLDSLRRTIADTNVSMEDRKKALQDIIDLDPKRLKGLTLEEAQYGKISEKINLYITALKLTAQAKALESKLSEQYIKQFELEQRIKDKGYEMEFNSIGMIAAQKKLASIDALTESNAFALQVSVVDTYKKKLDAASIALGGLSSEQQGVEKTTKTLEKALTKILPSQTVTSSGNKTNGDAGKKDTRQDDRLKAEEEYQKAVEASMIAGTEFFAKEYNKRNDDFEKSLENDLDKSAEAADKELKELSDHNAALLAEQVASAQRIADAKVNILKKRLATGTLSEEKYSQAVFELEEQGVQSTIDGIKRLLESTAVGTARRQELLTQLANAQQNLDNITTDNFINNENLKQAKLQETLKQVQILGGLAFDFVSALYDRQAQKYEEAKQKELAAAGDNETKKSAIEEKYAKKAAALKRKQAIADKLGALFQIAINTAVAVSKSLVVPTLIPFIIAAGALQAAAVLAKPIPAYKDGVKSAPRGLALVGEAGAELVEKNNRMQLIDSPSLVNLAGGETIYKNADTQKILASRKISPTSNDQGALVQTIVSSNEKLIQVIKTKKELYISASGSKIVERDGDYYTEYFNRKISWAGKRNSQH